MFKILTQLQKKFLNINIKIIMENLNNLLL